MKNKSLYTKVCPSCGKTFRTDNENTERCSSCVKKEQAAIAPPLEKKKKVRKASSTWDIPLAEFCRALTRYNDRCGTCYTYGQMTHAIDSGRISRKEFLRY